MNEHLQLYRKRIIPAETVLLKDDIILYADSSLVVTKWNSLKPRLDISYGYSAYFLDKGIKVNKVFNRNNRLVYWYCDIISHTFSNSNQTLTVTDLLVDILVYEDGSLKVLDLEEIADALEDQSLSISEAILALRISGKLLTEIYNNTFFTYQDVINSYISNYSVKNLK